MARVLVVDDDPDILLLVQIRLRNARYEVYAVTNALDALAILDNLGLPDVAVLDVGLPGITPPRTSPPAAPSAPPTPPNRSSPTSCSLPSTKRSATEPTPKRSRPNSPPPRLNGRGLSHVVSQGGWRAHFMPAQLPQRR
jgi:hypothetical protein